MITAKQCRIHAAECQVRASSIDISSQRSLEESVMALNWSALADEMDRERPSAIGGVFAAGRPYDVTELLARRSSSPSSGRSRRLKGIRALFMARSVAATAASLLGALPIMNKLVTETDHGQIPRSVP
jgi:hypothetical protein